CTHAKHVPQAEPSTGILQMGCHARSGASRTPRPVKILTGALSGTPVSARGSPAQKPWFGAARAVMQAGAAAVQIETSLLSRGFGGLLWGRLRRCSPVRGGGP